MQTNGSLAQTSLASLLETMQAERATGTLSVRKGDATCSLYFLFGHLFHAAGDLGQGEEAVISALGWGDGQFNFDPRAKLPAEETIKAGTADLLSEAERRTAEAPTNGAAPEVPAPVAVPEPALQIAGGPAESPTAPSSPQAPPHAPALDEPAAAWSDEPAPERRTEAQPLTATALSPAAHAVFGNPNAEPLGQLYPLPSGKAIYEGLKSAFVDFPKLLRTLDSDKLTGYVRLDGGAFSGVLLLHDGHVLDALFSDGGITQSMEAFQKLRQRMERGEGLLDVIELSGETVVALAQLLTAPPLFTGLLGRFINFEALLEYLNEEHVDGSLVVAGGTETGVILLRKGAILGAYTQNNRDLAASPNVVTALAGERTSRIEVKSGTAASPEGIDVDAALRVVY